jgi:hypothetical protein
MYRELVISTKQRFKGSTREKDVCQTLSLKFSRAQEEN